MLNTLDIVVCGADTVAHMAPGGRYAVISIASPGNPRASVPKLPLCRGVLFLAYDDIDTDMVFTNAGWRHIDEVGRDGFALFDAALAGRVLDFVLPLVGAIDTLVVQCEAGRSRSAGTAAALGRILLGDTDTVFRDPRFNPNLRVYRTLLAAAEARGALAPTGLVGGRIGAGG